MKRAILIMGLLILAVALSGCTQQTPSATGQQMYVCPSGDVVSNPQLCPKTEGAENSQQSTQTPTILPCPYDCCDSDRYDFKGCPTGKECINNTCVQQACPFECCDGSTYLKRDCAYNQECVNNQCLTAQCPYECCTGETYIRKDCSQSYQCLNNACSEIPIPKIAITIDECVTSQNVMQMLGEVTDIYITIENYGTKEAVNLQINSTANDVEQVIGNSQGTITALPAKSQKLVKLTVDTDSTTPTTVTVTATCAECEPQTINISESDCHYDIQKILDTAIQYAPVVGGFI